jgi:hypothetical protein
MTMTLDTAAPGRVEILDLIAQRRQAADPGDDFTGTLVTTVIDGERLSDMEILAVITALVTAGADTAVDLHTLADAGERADERSGPEDDGGGQHQPLLAPQVRRFGDERDGGAANQVHDGD